MRALVVLLPARLWTAASTSNPVSPERTLADSRASLDQALWMGFAIFGLSTRAMGDPRL